MVALNFRVQLESFAYKKLCDVRNSCKSKSLPMCSAYLASNLTNVAPTSTPHFEDPKGITLKKSIKLFSIVAAAALVGGVAVAPASNAAKPKVCLALDTGGVDDKSFNASAWAGAQATKNIADVSYVVADPANPDYAAEVKSLVDKKCDLIIGVGFMIAGEIGKAAVANPKIKFAQVDDPGLVDGKAVANLKGLTFASDQTAFLAGYLAAGYSKTKKVATYGGIAIPTVTIFMAGFENGVNHYNKVKGTNVKVLGWSNATKTGTFVESFTDAVKAVQISKNLEQQGADVIYPIAGGLTFATAGNSVTSKKSVVLGVDSDMFLSASAAQKDIFLNSTMKAVGASVKDVISSVAANKFSNAPYVGTLKNGGGGFAGYHNMASKVPAVLQNEIRQLTKDVISGAVKVS